MKNAIRTVLVSLVLVGVVAAEPQTQNLESAEQASLTSETEFVQTESRPERDNLKNTSTATEADSQQTSQPRPHKLEKRSHRRSNFLMPELDFDDVF
ncbi:MAG TPA: hypothetical protein EYO33_07300 [Phycisphaerales bacterium]|nr:hypothetical protein [Phycisphaerales bacterium]